MLSWALGLNLLFLVVEIIVGNISGSLALLSDAAHMVGDVAALTVALVIARLALRIAERFGRLGVQRIEALGGLLNSVAMLVLVAFIVREALLRLASGHAEIAPWPVLVVGVVGLLINLACAWWLAQGERDNLNVRGALLHMLGDALGSLGAVFAAVGLMLGFRSADALFSLGTAALVLVATLGLLRDTVRVLAHQTQSCTTPTCALCTDSA